MNEKYLIIGDLHIGQNRGNSIFYKILMDYGNFVLDTCDEYDINNLIFLGDIFDSRTAITLESLHFATEFFELFKEKNIDIVLGNHCVFFNDSTEIHSLAPFKNHPNITIHEKVCKRDNLTFCPWATKLEDIPQSDYVFGHFDIVGYELTKGKISNHGFKGVELMKRVNRFCFSGHYHIFQQRTYDGKPLIYTGSAYGLSFNDADSPKYLHILDTSTNEVQRIENTVSPKFKYIRTEADLTDIKGNFISVVSTDETLVEKVGAYSPAFVRKEIVDEFKKLDERQEEVKEFKVVDISEAIEEFSMKLPDEWELDEELKKEVSSRTNKLYDKLK